jgi:phosphoglycerate dehydrogenase-like enzyme
MPQWKALITVPEPLRSTIVRPAALAKLASLYQVESNPDGANWSSQQLAERLAGVDVLIASWGLPQLDETVMARADRLKLVGYAAGSVKSFATAAFWAKGACLSHAAFRIADSVAEFTLLAAMMGLRRPQDLDRQMKAGIAWPKSKELPLFEIRGRQVGLLGMGYVGQRAARLFQAVGAEVWAYDPYLAPERAAELGVRLAGLDELLAACEVVSVHLPVTAETHHLLGARELALLREGAVFINTARAWTVDQPALLNALQRGRIWAALDVFDPEPLPADDPLRALDNVLLTPHVAGLTVDCYQSLMSEMIDEAERLYRGEPLLHQVTQGMLDRMA